MSRTAITETLIGRIKESLFAKELTQMELASKYQVSQATISNIKNGKLGGEVPWPDGSVGMMPNIVDTFDPSLKDTPEDALRYDAWPLVAQTAMLNCVNEKRASLALPPIPRASKDLEAFQSTPMLTELEASDLEDRARKSEVVRKAHIMREFEAIVEERVAASRATVLEDLFRAPDCYLSEQEAAELEAINISIEELRHTPPTYESIPWDKILQAAPANPHVRAVLKSGCKVRREAVCITFAHVPESTWSQASLTRTIEDCRAILLAYPRLVAALPDLPAPAAPGRAGAAKHTSKGVQNLSGSSSQTQ